MTPQEIADMLPANVHNDVLSKLSKRETEIVLSLVCKSDLDSVGAQLGVAVHTVRNHLKNIFRKLQVNSQVELVTLVLRGSLHGFHGKVQ